MLMIGANAGIIGMTKGKMEELESGACAEEGGSEAVPVQHARR